MTSLNDVVTICNRYLLEAFDMPKPTAYIQVHPDETFKPEQSHYEPKSDTVHIPQTVDVARFIHEFYGHGLLHAYSKLGSCLSSLEDQIDIFEQAYDVPKNSRMLIQSSKGSPRVECAPQGSDYEVILFCDPQDKGVAAYLHMKKEYMSVFERTRPIQEGFALWMESVLLQGLGLTESIEKRQKELKGTRYNQALSEFATEVQQRGIFTSFYKMGFPKSTRPDIVVRFAKEHLKDFEGLKFLLMYGSGKRDIDLLAVYEDQARPRPRFIYNGDIDLHILGEGEFFGRVQKYDIELLEPVLGGQLLLGDQEGYGNLRTLLETNKPGEEAIRYHQQRALETFATSGSYLDRHKSETLKKMIQGGLKPDDVMEDALPENPTRDLSYAINSIAFSLTYLISSEMFSLDGTVLSHKEMLKRDPLLRDVTAYLKDVENGRVLPSRRNVLSYHERAKSRIVMSGF